MSIKQLYKHSISDAVQHEWCRGEGGCPENQDVSHALDSLGTCKKNTETTNFH